MLRRAAAAAAAVAVAPPSMTSLEPPQLRMRQRCLPRLSSANAALTLVSAMEWGAAAVALVAGCNKSRSRLSRGHLDHPLRALPTRLPVCFPWFSLAAAEGATSSPEISTSCLCRVEQQQQPTLDITSRKFWRPRRQLASPLRLSKRGQGMSTL